MTITTPSASASVAVVQPVYGHIPPSAAISMQRLIAVGVANRLVVHVDHRLGTYIDNARNQLVQACLDHPNKPSHMMFVDQDMVLPLDSIARLAAHDLPVVGGAYFLKTEPFTPVAYNFHPSFYMLPKLPHRKLARVGGVGMGCTLINLDVMRELESHFGDKWWFKTDDGMGEDVWFSYRCRQAGIPIHLDRTVSCGHVGDVEVSEQQYQFALERRESRGDQRDEDLLHARNQGKW